MGRLIYVLTYFQFVEEVCGAGGCSETTVFTNPRGESETGELERATFEKEKTASEHSVY